MTATATREETITEFDAAKAEAFAGQLLDSLDKSLIVLNLSLGHKTGLFDVLAGLPPSTIPEIAAASRLNERYVREWLNGGVVGGVIEYDPATRRYNLPPEHAAFLTRAAGVDNLAYFAQYIKLFSAVEDDVVECFRTGGGVPYSAYADFQRLQAGESGPVYDATLVQRTLPNVPGIVERLEAGIDVADFGCGQGHAVNVMARAFPNSRFTGYDISEAGLAAARAEAEAWGLTNARFEVADVAKASAPGAFDFITAFDAIHDQVAPRAVLRNIREALRPGGTFLMVDIAGSSNVEENLGRPLAAGMYTISLLHCMTVSLAGGGEGLGTMWGEQKARELLAEAGFSDVQVTQIEGDLFNCHYVCR